MIRLSINEMTTYRWPFERDVATYAEAGINAIGVWRQKLSDFGDDRGIELLTDHGLRVSNLLWAGGFTGSDGRNFRESLEDAEEAIRLADAMQAGCLVIYSGARNGHTANHCRRLVRSALAELAPMADDFGVTLAIEPMHVGCAAEWTFLTDLEETFDLISQVDTSCLHLTFDTYHLGQVPRIVERIPDIVDRIAIVHLGDGKGAPRGEQNRCCLGEGTLPLAEMVTALIDAGYTGDFDVELFGEEVETAEYIDLIAHSQQAFRALLGAENCRA
ncbi:MAG: sugar phosphate isomerase/epimerase family protein [Pirellulales bacterium]